MSGRLRGYRRERDLFDVIGADEAVAAVAGHTAHEPVTSPIELDGESISGRGVVVLDAQGVIDVNGDAACGGGGLDAGAFEVGRAKVFGGDSLQGMTGHVVFPLSLAL